MADDKTAKSRIAYSHRGPVEHWATKAINEGRFVEWLVAFDDFREAGFDWLDASIKAYEEICRAG